jgi:regulator of protease activity HflC (stomatin/prohibitin superfamily)
MPSASPSTFVLFVLVVFALIVLAKSIKVVPQKQVKLIERLGRFHKRADAGLNVIVPFLDSVRATIDLREQITQIEPQPVITRDNVTMKVDAVIYFVVADPVRATYEVQNLTWGIEQLTLSGLRNVIGALDLDHTLTSRDTINTQLRSALDQATQQWGVKIMRVELKNIDPPQDIKLTMEKQMTAERTRRAMVTNAEGEKASAILKAEGQKQSQIVSAEGEKQSRILEAEGQAAARLRVAEAEAQAIKVVADAIGSAGNPAQYLIAQRYLEAFSQLGANADRIVYLPWEASGVLASLGGIRDIVSGGGAEGAAPTPPAAPPPPTPPGPRPAPPYK